MKNMIMDYYNIDEIKLFKQGEKYKFTYNLENYCLEKVKITEEELKEIISIKIKDNKYNKIIKNKYNQLVTKINNELYILINIKKRIIKPENELIRTIYIKGQDYSLNRSNWTKLWQNKIDYYEYQLNHIKLKYKLIGESIDYYIGMAENAISYIYETEKEAKKTVNDKLCVAHKRINEEGFYDPLNIVFDYKARDISELLKYYFFNKKVSEELIIKVISYEKLSEYQLRLIYGRLFYPSFYFDVYDKIIKNEELEKKLIKIIYLNNDYERFLSKVYNCINTQKKIPQIKW